MESKTLSYSEQEALNCILKLIQLGFVPSEAWDAIDWGRVKDVGYDQGFGGEWKLKERQITVEWKKLKVATRLVLRGEIPLNSPSVQEQEIQTEAAQKRWWVRKIQIVKLDTLDKSAEETLEIAEEISIGLTIKGDDCLCFLSGAHCK